MDVIREIAAKNIDDAVFLLSIPLEFLLEKVSIFQTIEVYNHYLKQRERK